MEGQKVAETLAEQINELLDIIDLEKRLQVGAMSSLSCSQKRMSEAYEKLTYLIYQKETEEKGE